MITVAVCSVNQQQLFEFKKNVGATIGCQHEVIAIDNTIHNENICSVYNKLAAMAAYDTICYCHEDIFFTTINWGEQLIKILWDKEASVGLVGVAGALYKSKYPIAWVHEPPQYYRNNIVQQTAAGLVYHTKLSEGLYSPVEVIDGCFIAGKKQTFNETPWNERDLTGFHLYDMDISLRVGRSCKVVVANGIELVHQSQGNFDDKWFTEAQKFCSLYKGQLPLDSFLKTAREKSEANYYSLIIYCQTLKRLGKPSAEIRRELAYLLFRFPIRKQTWGILKMYIKYILK